MTVRGMSCTVHGHLLFQIVPLALALTIIFSGSIVFYVGGMFIG